MKGLVDDIDHQSKENTAFRRVVHTGQHMQLVLMALKAGEEIGAETHQDHDQYFRVEKGKGEAWIDGECSKIKRDDAVFVPAGARHNIINTGLKPLKLQTLYAPPQHQDGVVFATRAEASAAKEHFDGETTQATKKATKKATRRQGSDDHPCD